MRKQITAKQRDVYASFLHQKGFYRNSSKSDFYSVTYSKKTNEVSIDVNMGTWRQNKTVEISYQNLITGERKALSSFQECLTRTEDFKQVIESLLK